MKYVKWIWLAAILWEVLLFVCGCAAVPNTDTQENQKNPVGETCSLTGFLVLFL